MSTPAAADESVLDALYLALAEGGVPQPADGRTLFLRAREGGRLPQLERGGWVCEQTFLPYASRLGRARLQVVQQVPDERFGRVLALPPRQRDEARAVLARAVAHLAPGGTVVAAMANSEGARSGEKDLAELAGPVRTLSKHKCRVFWCTPGAGDIDPDRLQAWQALDARREIAGGRYVSRPGLFAWDRVDPASELLAAHLPPDLSGEVADLGAGYGYLAVRVLERCPGVTRLDLYEAEARALEPARVNMRRALQEHPGAVAEAHWHDVTTGLPRRYDALVSNPPFHLGRADLPALGQAFLRSAAEALRPGGRLWLVANRHLPYERTLDAHFALARTVVEDGRFKVIEAAARDVRA